MKQLFFASMLMISSITISAQGWHIVGAGLAQDSSDGMVVKVHRNEIYVAEIIHSSGFSNPQIRVKKWNGVSWTTYPLYNVQLGWPHLGDMEIYQGEVYVGLVTDFYSAASLIKFDGNSWVDIPDFTVKEVRSIHTLEVYNGELYIGGWFTLNVGASTYENVVKFDGNNYTALPGLAGANMAVRDLHSHNGAMHCISDSLYQWNGTAWDNPSSFLKGTSATRLLISELQSYNNELFGAGQGGLYHLSSNDTAYYLHPLNFKVTDMDVYNNELYVVGDSAKMGPGAVGGLIKYDGQSLTTVAAPPSLRQGESYQGELYYFSPLTVTYNGQFYNRAFKAIGGFSIISGRAFIDQNADCFHNAGELTLKNALVSIGGVVVTTDSLGYYSVAVPAGTYNLDTFYVAASFWKNFKINCSLPTQITLGNGQTITQDLPVSNNVAVDAQVFFTSFRGWGARHGFNESYRLEFNNAGNQTLASGSAVLEWPSSLNLVSSNPAASSSTGNTLTYDFLNIQPGETKQVELKFKIDTAQNAIGDTLNFYSYITGVTGDADLSDNTDTLVQTVTAAVDPNDKQASATRILPGTERIDYHIRFQNTGNDTAVKVTVVDTLDLTLPLTKIIINSASHPYSLSVKNNILIWEFDNIMLPDSASDPTGSKGYVRFSAGINPALGVGDTIVNDAEIYFDYQLPIHTNFAKTAIVQWLGEDELDVVKAAIRVYPNPSVGEIKINTNSDKPVQLQLIDMNGRVLDVIRVSAGEEKLYQLKNLPRGTYLLKSGTETYRLIVQ